MKKLVIVGASGHGKVAADIAKLRGYDEIVFLDDNKAVSSCGAYPVKGGSDMLGALSDDGYEAFVAIGNGDIRKHIMSKMDSDITVATLIHPAAVVAEDVKIGKGSIVMAGAVINPGTIIGEGCIINTSSSVDHDNVIGDYVHVSVGAHLAGSVKVGERTWISAGVTVINNIEICENCMIGAGAVVVKNLTESGKYLGLPARKVKSHII